MELRMPPRLRLAPDLVSSPPPPGKQRLHPEFVSSPSPPGKRAPKQRLHPGLVSSPSPPGKRAPKERLRPGLVSLPSPPRKQDVEKMYERDIWTEVARHLHGTDLVRLALTCHWFHNLLFFDDDSIWCYALRRDLSLHTNDPKLLKFTNARPSQPSWHSIYATTFNNSHAYSFRQPEKHIESLRIAGFLVDTPKLFMTAKLALPQVCDSSEITIELTGSCLISNVRPGIWIADINMVQCSPCNIDGCKGTMHVLDARHCELYLESKFRDGTWEYEDLGTYSSYGPLDAATAAIFNHSGVNTQHVANVLDVESWMRTRTDLLPRACFTPVAVALCSNLGPNTGLLSRFQVMRDMSGAGEIVSMRIIQQVL